jgi:hypothetical protein
LSSLGEPFQEVEKGVKHVSSEAGKPILTH